MAVLSNNGEVKGVGWVRGSWGGWEVVVEGEQGGEAKVAGGVKASHPSTRGIAAGPSPRSSKDRWLTGLATP